MVSACTNCGTPSACDSCDRCNNLTACRLCKRRLPRHCFDFADSTICQACEKKMKKPTAISSTRQIVTEVEIPTNESDISFETDKWNSRGSGFVIERLIKFVICITQYRPLYGSTYVKTPAHIANKYCVENVKNDDEKCFVWAVLSALYQSNNHKQNKTYNYAKYMGVLSLHGLSFPIKTIDIPRFEIQNPFISVNVLYYDVENRNLRRVPLAPQRSRKTRKVASPTGGRKQIPLRKHYQHVASRFG